MTDFKDFTGGKIALGTSIYGLYPLNGLIKDFSYSPLALNNNEMLAMYYNNRVKYEYDTLGRLTKRTINAGANSFETSYSYIPGNVTGATTSKLSSISNNGIPIEYEYDANGNITKIIEDGRENVYYYNELNELIQEDSQRLNKSIIYSYDLGGNILGKTEIIYGNGESRSTIIYDYDSIWKDQVKLDSDGGYPTES